MSEHHLIEKANNYLERLCLEHPHRCVGSAGNRAATDLVAQALASCGFRVESPEFDCFDWQAGEITLKAGRGPFESRFEAYIGPYSPGCQAGGRLVVASTIEELEALEASEALLLLRGEIASEQLMPKNFPFYNPEAHQRIYRALETKAPLAIVAATGRNPELAGAVYPFPLIEDGDFDIPSAYMTEEEGERLAGYAGQEANLRMQAERIPARSCNVIARKGPAVGPRVVFTAHVDGKQGTPGALDNAAGVVALLLLADLLREYRGRLGIEITAINGEDHYSAAGEIQYLRDYKDTLKDITLNINLDGVGAQGVATAYSLYECPEGLAGAIRGRLGRSPGFVEGEAWYQGDHMIFVQSGVPAVALTSANFMEIETQVAHTERDRPELVDTGQLARIARALAALVEALSTNSTN